MNKKRILVEICCGIILLVAAFYGGYAYANRNLGVLGELQKARYKIEYCFMHDAVTQVDMNLISGIQGQLAIMELQHLEHMIYCQDNYSEIQEEFIKDEKLWQEQVKKLQEEPSEFEGGSFATTANNMQMTSLLEQRISLLKTKYLKK